MGLWPTEVMKKRFGPATTLCGTADLSFVIPSEAEGSAVPRTFRGNVFRQSAHWPAGPPKVMKTPRSSNHSL
jgi:hypothetical protein